MGTVDLFYYGMYQLYRNTLEGLMIRPAMTADVRQIATIAVDTEMFAPEETAFVGTTLEGSLDGSLEGHRWLVHTDENGSVVGAAYYAPEPFSDRLWNLYFIAVDPTRQGDGVGGALLAQVQRELRELGPDIARILIVETSSTDQYRRTRDFYPQHAFVEEARIREFYGPDDDKVIFWKSLLLD